MKLLFFLFILVFQMTWARQIWVGTEGSFSHIKEAISAAHPFDTIVVNSGFYQEGNILINKPLYLKGINYPVLDGSRKFEVISVKSNHVTITGFRIQHSSYATLDDPGGIKVYEAEQVQIYNNVLYDNFFGIYLQYCKKCIVKNNIIVAFGKEEQAIGNGVHCWKCDSLQIIANHVSGHRDGIYFEFVTDAVIWRNQAINNVRYGLHFMFSNNDTYIANIFKNNGAGVAVMYSKKVNMLYNIFQENWGDAAYGLLFKEISDCYMSGNQFIMNTIGIFMDGTNRILVEKNNFKDNGWGMKIQANCMDNMIKDNNFILNTFDVSTNGSLTLNIFSSNYWDKYEGYDLNKDQIGDVSYHPLSLFSYIVEQNPASMLLFRSFMVTLLDKSEKILPSLTPENFVDHSPRFKSLAL